MNAKLAIVLSIVVVTTAGCSTMGRMFSGSGGDRSAMSGSSSMSTPAPVPVDPAGSATFGTGSVSRTGADQRMDTAAGIGLAN